MIRDIFEAIKELIQENWKKGCWFLFWLALMYAWLYGVFNFLMAIVSIEDYRERFYIAYSFSICSVVIMGVFIYFVYAKLKKKGKI